MSARKPSFNDMKTDEMRKHLFQYNKLVKEEAELKGIRTMKRTPLLEQMKRKFEIVKDPKGFYASPKEKKVLMKEHKFFRDNRPEKFKKKEVVKKVKKSELKKKEEKPKPTTLLENLKKLVNKYNKDEIKKQKLTKENLKKYTNPYFDLSEKIEKQLKEVDDPVEFLKKNKELSKKYADVSKNFIRRINAQMKANKKK